VTTPDLEITASLRARSLISHVPPDSQTQSEGEDVELPRDQRRRGLPTQVQPGRHYDDVAIEKRVLGRIVSSWQTDTKA
jgi:hypothetical protein